MSIFPSSTLSFAARVADAVAEKYKGDPEDKPRRTLADLAERLRRRRLEEAAEQHQ